MRRRTGPALSSAVEDLGRLVSAMRSPLVTRAVHLDDSWLSVLASRAAACPRPCADGVDLVDEDDAGACFLPCSTGRDALAPTPTKFDESEPEMLKKGPRLAGDGRASSVCRSPRAIIGALDYGRELVNSCGPETG